jgi:hypothetical protein
MCCLLLILSSGADGLMVLPGYDWALLKLGDSRVVIVDNHDDCCDDDDDDDDG